MPAWRDLQEPQDAPRPTTAKLVRSISDAEYDPVIRLARPDEVIVSMGLTDDVGAVITRPRSGEPSIWSELNSKERKALLEELARLVVRSEYHTSMMLDHTHLEQLHNRKDRGLDPNRVLARNLFSGRTFCGGTCRHGNTVFAAKLLEMGVPEEHIRFRKFKYETRKVIDYHTLTGEPIIQTIFTSHVSTEVNLDGEWIEFDATPGNQSLKSDSSVPDKTWTEPIKIMLPPTLERPAN